ncbi:MAG: hypothetical protein AAF903_15180 [Pseudomonadota bacterium]
MSLVATAIIAGASAGLTAAADDVVKSLYQSLKSNIFEMFSESIDEIEVDPESEKLQKQVDSFVQEKNLNEIDKFTQLSKALLDRLDMIEASLPDSVLVRVKELVARGDINFSNIDLNGGALLEADRVKAGGGFSISNLRSGRGSSSVPFVKIGSATANTIDISISEFSKKFSELPRYMKFLLGAGFAFLIVIVTIPFLMSAWESSQARKNFDETFKRQRSEMGSGFMSSSNYLTSTIPNSIYQTNDRDHWQRVNYSWNKHSRRLNKFLQPLAACLSEGTCALGEKGDEVCQIARSQQAAHKNIHDRIKGINGLNIDYTGGGGFGGAFGPNIVVPRIRVVNYIADDVC